MNTYCPECGCKIRKEWYCQHYYGKYIVYYHPRELAHVYEAVETRSGIRYDHLFQVDRWIKMDEDRIEKLLVLK